jgi:hypothetical protein
MMLAAKIMVETHRLHWYGTLLIAIGGCGLGIQAVNFLQQSLMLSWFAAGVSIFSLVLGVILSARNK